MFELTHYGYPDEDTMAQVRDAGGSICRVNFDDESGWTTIDISGNADALRHLRKLHPQPSNVEIRCSGTDN